MARLTVGEALAACDPEWRPYLERLLDHVLERDGCWLLFKCRRVRGRLRLRWLPGQPSNRKVTATRLIYTLFVGPIPPGSHVRRTCAEPHCISPDHLEARPPRRFAAFGRELTLPSWERATGIPRPTLHYRIITCGWSVERALTQPPERRP